MRLFIILLSSAAFFTACNNEPASQTHGDTTTRAIPVRNLPDTSMVGCYAYITQRDTITMQLESKGGSLSGPLLYKIYEKDRNDGTFTGEETADEIRGWYLFRSEGIMSVRQVIWKKGNDKLIPATGDMLMRGDTLLFRDPAKLSFDSTMALTRIECII